MFPDPSIRIDPAWRGAFARVLRVPAGFDFVVRNLAETVSAGIDLILFGRSLTGTLPPEQLLPFFRSLASSLAALAEGRSRKALVQFSESPWELAIVRHPGDMVALSLYEVVAPARVSAESVEMPLSALRDAVVAALDRLIEDAAALPHHQEVTRWSRRLEDCRRHAASATVRPLAAVPAAGAAPARLPVETRSSAGLLLATELRPRQDALLHYDGEHALDRHALLVPGSVAIVPEGRRGLRLDGRPLFMLEALLDAVDGALDDLETRRPFATELQLVPGDVRVLTVADDEASLTPRDAPASGGSVRLPAVDCFLALAQHIEDVHAACLLVNPLLDANGHLRELLDHARDLRRRILARSASTPRVHSARLQQEAEQAEVARRDHTGAFPFSFGSVRFLRSERAWHTELTTARPETLRAIGENRLSIIADGSVLLLDRHAGHVSATWPLGGGAQAATRGLDAAFTEGCRLSLANLATGDTRVVELSEPAAVQSIVRVGPWLVLAYRSGQVEARDPSTGALGWTCRISVGVAPLLHTSGSTLLVGSRAGEIVALRLEDGATLWRHEAHLPLRSWSVSRGVVRLGLWHGRRQKAAVSALDLRDGERLAHHAQSAEEASFAVAHGMLAVLDDGDARTLCWLHPDLPGQPLFHPVPQDFLPGQIACTASEDCAWIRADRQLICLRRTADGLREDWRASLPDDGPLSPLLASPLQVRGDVLAVVGNGVTLHAADTGRLVHTIPATTEEVSRFLLGPRAGATLLERRDDGSWTLSTWRTAGLLAPV